MMKAILAVRNLEKDGRGALGKAIVLISVEVNDGRIGRIRLQRIPDASAESLEAAVQNVILPGSVIQSDKLERIQ